jgi:hypothetical protein
LNFDSLADFLAGKVAPAGTAILRGATSRTFTMLRSLHAGRLENYSRLTLNLGFRYEYLGVFREQGDRLELRSTRG